MNTTVDMKYRPEAYGCLPGRRMEDRAGRGPSCQAASGKEAAGEAGFAGKITYVMKREEQAAAGSPAMGAAAQERAEAAKVTAGASETEAARGAAGASRVEAAGVTAGASETEAARGTAAQAGADTLGKSPRDMSLEEYASYIYGQIRELSRRNYSRGNSVFIYISEEGFRAMQNDPEYEAWVMENVRQAYYHAGHRGGHDGYHSAHFFGATKEEYRGQSWSSGCSKCEQERRRELKRRRKQQLQALLKKRQAQKLLEKQRLEKLYQEKRRLEKSVYKKLLIKKEAAEEQLEEEHRREALARREAASAFRMYMALLKYSEQ